MPMLPAGAVLVVADLIPVVGLGPVPTELKPVPMGAELALIGSKLAPICSVLMAAKLVIIGPDSTPTELLPERATEVKCEARLVEFAAIEIVKALVELTRKKATVEFEFGAVGKAKSSETGPEVASEPGAVAEPNLVIDFVDDFGAAIGLDVNAESVIPDKCRLGAGPEAIAELGIAAEPEVHTEAPAGIEPAKATEAKMPVEPAPIVKFFAAAEPVITAEPGAFTELEVAIESEADDAFKLPAGLEVVSEPEAPREALVSIDLVEFKLDAEAETETDGLVRL